MYKDTRMDSSIRSSLGTLIRRVFLGIFRLPLSSFFFVAGTVGCTSSNILRIEVPVSTRFVMPLANSVVIFCPCGFCFGSCQSRPKNHSHLSSNRNRKTSLQWCPKAIRLEGTLL